jgi:uncharacterized glyoxalase superfamily protein PhnB
MRSLYPVILSKNVQISRDFYIDLFDFIPIFETDWYKQLEQRNNRHAQLGIVAQYHESVPEGYRESPRGIVITADYEDITTVYQRVVTANIKIVYPLTNEEWGQKHFMVVDPDKVLVDISQITQAQ